MGVNRCYGCMAEVTQYPCAKCGYDPRKNQMPDYALKPETILNGKFLVGRVLGQGGFGITYVGWDLALERKIAIKEYFPAGQVTSIFVPCMVSTYFLPKSSKVTDIVKPR